MTRACTATSPASSTRERSPPATLPSSLLSPPRPKFFSRNYMAPNWHGGCLCGLIYSIVCQRANHRCTTSAQPSCQEPQTHHHILTQGRCHSRKLTGKLEGQRLTDIVVEAVDIEKEFICEALPVDLIGMNKGLMSQYIDFCADRLLVALGAQKHYNTPNPFDWMELLSLQ